MTVTFCVISEHQREEAKVIDYTDTGSDFTMIYVDQNNPSHFRVA